jgi:hypothetical protein
LDYEDLTTSLIDIFKPDPKYLENEERYKPINLQAEILGEESDDESDSGSDEEEL